MLTRREAIAAFAAATTQAATRLPANQNVKWACSAALWGHFKRVPLTEILDIMKDTGFIGIRVTGFPAFLETYGMTTAQIEKEVSKRNLNVVTISFSGPTHDPAARQKVLADAKRAMEFLSVFGAKDLVVFSPARQKSNFDMHFKNMCEGFNQIGELAGTMGFRAGLHNHLNQMVEKPDEVDKCMAMTDPKLFWFSPDCAHLNLAGYNVPKAIEKYKDRLITIDYKDSKWTTPTADWVEGNGKVYAKDSENAKFFNSIYDMGDGEIDFPAVHRILKANQWKGWLISDLDTAREGPRKSYEHQAAYVVSKLEPIYK